MSMSEANWLYDVIATNISTGEQRLIAGDKTKEDAKATMKMVIARLGVDVETFSVAPSGTTRLGVGDER